MSLIFCHHFRGIQTHARILEDRPIDQSSSHKNGPLEIHRRMHEETLPMRLLNHENSSACLNPVIDRNHGGKSRHFCPEQDAYYEHNIKTAGLDRMKLVQLSSSEGLCT
jgi:hypothetical protein